MNVKGNEALPCADGTVVVNDRFGGAVGKNTSTYQWPLPSAVVEPDPCIVITWIDARPAELSDENFGRIGSLGRR